MQYRFDRHKFKRSKLTYFLERKVSKRTFNSRPFLWLNSNVRCPSEAPFDRLTFLQESKQRTFHSTSRLWLKSSVRCPSEATFDRHKSKRSKLSTKSIILKPRHYQVLRFFVSISTNIKWRKVCARAKRQVPLGCLRGKGRRVSVRLRAVHKISTILSLTPLAVKERQLVER